MDKFFGMFTDVKKAIDNSQEMLRQVGYVEDPFGRRRHLPIVNEEPYLVEAKLSSKDLDVNFNPIIGCNNRIHNSNAVNFWRQAIDMYILMEAARSLCSIQWDHYDKETKKTTKKTVEEIRAGFDSFKLSYELKNYKNDELTKMAMDPARFLTPLQAKKLLKDFECAVAVVDSYTYISTKIQGGEMKSHRPEPIPHNEKLQPMIDWYVSRWGHKFPTSVPTEPTTIQARTGKIAKAYRQCFNARIQGGAASLTKLAMVAIENDPQMNAWDAHLVITVHDEVLVECPEQYADLVEKRLPEIMVGAAKDNGINVPMACDPYNVTHWYEDEAAAEILDAFKKLMAGDEDKGIAGLSREEAIMKIHAEHPEHMPCVIDRVLSGEADQLEF